MLAGTVNEYFYKVHVINFDIFIDSLNKLAESDLKKIKIKNLQKKRPVSVCKLAIQCQFKQFTCDSLRRGFVMLKEIAYGCYL